MYQLISGKYFNKKELLMTSFTNVMSLMERESPWIKDAAFRQQYIEMAFKQVEKFSKSNVSYKNQVIESINQLIQVHSSNLNVLKE